MSPAEESPGPVIRDLRRIDPATGQVKNPGQGQGQGQQGTGQPGGGPRAGKTARPGRHAASRPGGAAADEAAAPGQAEVPESPDAPGKPAAGDSGLAAQLAERTADLQRVTAEYANYRKRVERDRMAVREQALANVLTSLLPVLDDIGRAREHGELVGGFKSVADSLESATSKLGLVSFGDEGEPFDPTVHEALTHSYSADVTEPTAVAIFQPGYKVGERILRPARVAVAEPEEASGPGETPGDGDAAAAAGQASGDREDAAGAAESQGNRAEDN
jgi:molecular chaperone GrpE